MRALGKIKSGRRRVLVAALLVLALASFLRLYHIGWCFSSDGVDEGVMLERSFMVSHGYRLYSNLPCDQAPLAFYMGAFLGGGVLILRSSVALLSIAAIAVSMAASRRLAGSTGMLATGLLLAVDFAFLRESRLFSLDAISSSFLAFSLLPFLAYVTRGHRGALAIAGVMVGLSTAAKLLGVLGLIGMLAFMAVEWASVKEQRGRRAVDALVLVASSAIPLGLFMIALGPGNAIQGMVFDQGHRGFEFGLKLCVPAYFGVNLAYLLPIAWVRRMWRERPEHRFLLSVSLVLLAFMVFQPLTFFHHLVMLSPPLAILAGAFISETIHSRSASLGKGVRAATPRRRSPSVRHVVAVALAGVLVSSGLGAYGLVIQSQPIQEYYSELIRQHSSPGQMVVSGDPLMTAMAGRLSPPGLIDVAYRQYPGLTEQALESEILEYNVTVIVVCYRLNDMTGLPAFLAAHGYHLLATQHVGREPVLSLFESGIGPIQFYCGA